jgi:Na+-transporting NADH:ubiquinone oxidoreductase subunit C
MFNKEALNTLIVAFVLCLVCSVLVSTVAVALKPQQEINKALDRNKNILAAAGMFDAAKNTNKDVKALFEQFTIKLVDVESGKFATDAELKALNIDPISYEQRTAAKDPKLSKKMLDDPAGILRQAKYAKVYLLEQDGSTQLIVLPVHGYGLWGTLYGFLVLKGDANEVIGLAFYEHKETPGLGAKVDTEKWKALWPGQHAYKADGSVAIEVVKGKAHKAGQIDGLSGATLTTRGVNHLIQFWLGEEGFAPFLKNFKAGEA